MHRFRRTTIHSWIWLIPLLIMNLPDSQAGTSPANIMSKAMIAMMDTMGELAHRFKGDTDWDFDISSSPSGSWHNWGGSPWGKPGRGYYPGYSAPIPGVGPYAYSAPGFDGLPMRGLAPRPKPPTTRKSVLDGIWIGRGGEIVLVMYGHFRIYANAEVYRDGRYRIVGNKLLMLDPETELVQEYDYALDNGRMIMRSDSGDFLYFKQLPIPIPPYTLIEGIKSAK
ncbi:MAG: hypothetical protein K1563_05730 [Candidatus Thiodiazotropha sp. (ex. Lucinisca nassula)]|nr:hypothetical protein [Candidatus Thiodiazotropha sp. (ex. Lucinisca nassula)]MBW9273170.1 hypothetical protein [Candidatus Thiodiazotropha sp. (ex. Lucinisca nassula)]PUB83076.1 MAG: hypothetical protein DBP02_12415 [gamma proteobacterium symbiont of Ctena orbiculata]